MDKYQKLTLFLSRITMGWMMFYAGITKVLNPEWTSAGYLKGAKAFTGLYNFFASPDVLPFIDFVNQWGLTLLGVSLVFGVAVRFSSVLGALLMLLYYLPLGFPYPNPHAYLVDEHIIYMVVLLYFAAVRAGRVYGLENWCSNLSICARFPKLRDWLG